MPVNDEDTPFRAAGIGEVGSPTLIRDDWSMAMSIEIALQAMEERLEPLKRVIRLFTASLGEPTLRKSDDERGFRYEAPDVRHFCLLKAVRALSALNAAIELARKGYTQEIAVLMRTLIECTTHIEFVLETDDSEGYRAAVRK